MDSGSPEHKPLKRKKRINGGEDLIGKLPEPLVSRILSLLPTKDAVRTSVLSKRWKKQWRSVTKLDLDDSVFFTDTKKIGGRKQLFLNFVYRLLLLTESLSLESFSLGIGSNYYKYDASLVNTWISSVLKKNLKRLCIHSQIELPFSSDTSESLFNGPELLEELVLNMYRGASITFETNYVHFRYLKLLKLHGIAFTFGSSKGSNYSNGLNFTLPLLQRIEIVNCSWLGVNRVTFHVPLLESVIIEQTSGAEHYERNICPIDFSASHLTEFTYRVESYISEDITLIDPSSAHNASASIILSDRDWHKNQETQFSVLSLLNQLSQVKYLKFEGSEVVRLFGVGGDLPEFKMLNHLELGLVRDEALLLFLLRSPVLKTLIFKKLHKIPSHIIPMCMAYVPDCLQHTLEVVKFGEVEGLEHELWVAKYMMENGLVLKRMSFSVDARIGKSKAFEDFKEKLFSVKKGLNLAIVEFSYS